MHVKLHLSGTVILCYWISKEQGIPLRTREGSEGRLSTGAETTWVMRHESDSDRGWQGESQDSEETESPLATSLGAPQRRHSEESQLIAIETTSQALGQEYNMNYLGEPLNNAPRQYGRHCWGLPFFLPHKTSVLLEATTRPYPSFICRYGCGPWRVRWNH